MADRSVFQEFKDYVRRLSALYFPREHVPLNTDFPFSWPTVRGPNPIILDHLKQLIELADFSPFR